MYIKTDGWSDSEEPDSLSDKYPHKYSFEVYVDDDTRKRLEEEGQLQAVTDNLLDWFSLEDDWREFIQ
jgi:hypothetical protein